MKYIILFIKKTLRLVLKPLSFVPAVAMMYLIFSMSAQNGSDSGNLSFMVSCKLVQIYNKLKGLNMTDMDIITMVNVIHPYVRKAAHMTEYCLLAMSVGLPLYVYRIRGIALTFLDGLICVLYAMLDEYHQTFVSGRAGSPKDVMIDSIGIIVGCLIIRIVGFIGKNTIFKPLSLDGYEIEED